MSSEAHDEGRRKLDELATAVGHALSLWTQVEVTLTQLFHILSGILETNRAYALFDSVISLDARLAMCDTLMKMDGLSKLDLKIWSIYKANIGKLYKKRHSIAHFSMIAHNGNFSVAPFYTVDKLFQHKQVLLSRTDIECLGKSFSELASATFWFYGEARRRRGTLEGGSMQEPPLIVQFRASACQVLE